MYELNEEIEVALVINADEKAGPMTLTAQLLGELIADEPRATSLRQLRAPRPERRKHVYVGYMSDDERRTYKAKLQRERRAKLKQRADEDNVVVFDSNSAREALADAALVILATNAPGADQVRKYLAGVYRTQAGAILTLEARIKSGAMRPKLIKYTRPKAS